MDVNAMDGTYVDYVENAGVEQHPASDEQLADASARGLIAPTSPHYREPLGQEPNALADHTDQEETTSPKTGDAAAIERVKGVVKDLIDAGNMYWAREILTALDPGSMEDHD